MSDETAGAEFSGCPGCRRNVSHLKAALAAAEAVAQREAGEVARMRDRAQQSEAREAALREALEEVIHAVAATSDAEAAETLRDVAGIAAAALTEKGAAYAAAEAEQRARAEAAEAREAVLREALEVIASYNHGRDCPRGTECDDAAPGDCPAHDRDCPACDCTTGLAHAALEKARKP